MKPGGLDDLIREDTGAWFESSHCKIWPKDRTKGLITPQQNYLQRLAQEVIAKFEELGLPVRLIGLKPRQKGSTTYFAACDYTMLRRHPVSACVIGGQYSQTKELWEMLQTYQKNDRFDWGNSGDINAKDGNWTHGSKLKPETAGDQLAGIAGTYQVLHATEVARWSKYGVANAADVLANILKCVPALPDTMVILESTAEGASGAFYERWLTAVDADDFLRGTVTLQPGQYVRIFAPWFEFADSAMRLSFEQKEKIRRTLDQDDEYAGEQELIDRYGETVGGITRLGKSVVDFDVWEQLAWRRMAIHEECKRDRAIFDRDYPHSWQDAFMKSGNLRFNSTGLAQMRKRLSLRVPEPGIFETRGNGIGFRSTEKHEAQVILFEKPQYGCKYLMAIDPMTGASQVSGQDPDFHGAWVLRAGYYDGQGQWHKKATAARVIRCRWDIDVLADVAFNLARYYGSSSGCKIVVEMNQDRGITELLKQRSADLYQREIFNQREFKTTLALGYQTNPKTRENLIEALAKDIREWDKAGDGIDVFDSDALEQFENFIVTESGKSQAAEGHHDDDVLAIALANHLIEHSTTYVPMRRHGLPPDLAGMMPGTGQQGLAGPFS